ncbi:YfbM family protein [Streptomyces hydrogenans]|uniref:DUF1877 domain-containing protein n=1 Tax=Streptomyces hydrogenans TaxID=1873719 RepID=A0ABQ3PS53_9ACTN|nr:YfbM family protein [Streptomyces hydrogenans]GHG43846.1 hypothetical protein GCM10018784_67230 [Streptomyces hydrogenans]GHI27850.1 hypothetical protein Shyd_92210 [Streptomyces hydrogenans]
MSMNGAYLRLTPEELARALDDPEWAWGFAEESLDEDGEGAAPARARHFTTGQTWHVLGFLLERAAFPVDVVMGEELLTGEPWGYEPPRYLAPDRVRLAADALRRTTYDRLVEGVEPAELTEAEIHPPIWESAASLDWARDAFASLREYLGAAASAGQAVVVWID